MRREIMALLAMFGCQTAFADESLCASKYKIISDQFYVYNEKSAVSNAVMDRIATYVKETDISTIHPADAKAWRAAVESFIVAGQPMLQNLMKYSALGCSPKSASAAKRANRQNHRGSQILTVAAQCACQWFASGECFSDLLSKGRKGAQWIRIIPRLFGVGANANLIADSLPT